MPEQTAKMVDTVLSRELLDFVSANAEWLSAEVPGFAAALAWPQGGRGERRTAFT